MGIYSNSVLVSAGSNTAIVVCDLESSGIESPAVLAVDFSIVLSTSALVRYGIGFASNTPVSTVRQPFIPEDPNDPECTSYVATAWSVAPATPANYYRIFSLAGNVSEYVLFTFRNGLRLPPNSSLVVRSLSSSPLLTNIGWEIEL